MPTVDTFDHRDTGTPETVWAAAGLDHLPAADLTGVSRVVVVAAHPDDESLGAGGLLARAARTGLETAVLIATLGELSHPDSPTQSPDELARVRRTEVLAAIAELAPHSTMRLLGLPDGRLTEHLPALTASVAALITGPDTLVAAPWSGDRHPDHDAAGTAASSAARAAGARCWHYPIWAWHWGEPGDGSLPRTGLIRLELTPADRQAKNRALGQHLSQIGDLSPLPGDEAILSSAVLAHFRREHEIFVTETGPPTPESMTPQIVPAPPDQDPSSLPLQFFDDFYSAGTDPWGFETRWYERRKRALTLAALPRPRFRSAFEPGCSIGVLTAELAQRCTAVLATDISAAPLESARERLQDSRNVRLEQRRIPADWPAGQFDLVVLSEVGYYCGAADLQRLAGLAAAALTDDGVLIACHWRHPVEGYPQSGDEVHRVLRAQPSLAVLVSHVEEDFLLDVLVPAPARSVARIEGLLG